MKYLPSNTLAYFNAAPQVKAHDLSEIHSTVFSGSTAKYRQTCGLSAPQEDALTFYALNHCAALIRKSFTANEPLPEWARSIMEQYLTACSSQGTRLLHYILSITTREMRHLKQYVTLTPAKWELVKKAGGPGMVQFIGDITLKNEDQAVKHYMTVGADATIGQYIQAMVVGFNDMGWTSGGYGGPAWGKVAEAAASLIHGKTSLEMLLDVGYTLAHNGGPIFNKGMMYQQNSGGLITVLDVQRAGEVPELVLDPLSHGVTKPPDVVAAVKAFREQRLNEFRGWVDWMAVDAARPDKEDTPFKYQAQIVAQKKKHPIVIVAGKKTYPATTKVVKGKKIKITGEWAVGPHEVVEVYERVA